jgi:hypothetical protein
MRRALATSYAKYASAALHAAYFNIVVAKLRNLDLDADDA